MSLEDDKEMRLLRVLDDVFNARADEVLEGKGALTGNVIETAWLVKRAC
jgi:hypothetical protein